MTRFKLFIFMVIATGVCFVVSPAIAQEKEEETEISAEEKKQREEMEAKLSQFFDTLPFSPRNYNACTIQSEESPDLVKNIASSAITRMMKDLAGSVKKLINVAKKKAINSVKQSASNYVCNKTSSISSKLVGGLSEGADTASGGVEGADSAGLKDASESAIASQGTMINDPFTAIEKGVVAGQRLSGIFLGIKKVGAILDTEGISGKVGEVSLPPNSIVTDFKTLDLNYGNVYNKVNQGLV